MKNHAEISADLLSLLAEDHLVVCGMIRRLQRLEGSDERAALFAELEERWLAHADIEDELLLTPLAHRPDSVEIVATVRACHAAIERVLDHLGSIDPAAEAWTEGLGALTRLVEEHVAEAELRLFEHARPALDPVARRAHAHQYHAALRDLAA